LGNDLLDSSGGQGQDGGEYSSYRHFASDLERTDPKCLIIMFTAYFDDSGTDGNSEIAVAACYVSTKTGWDNFVTGWGHARVQEGFDTFHMADFVAPPEQRHEPFCDWDKLKKDHVYQRLAKIINENKRAGFAIAIHKELWNKTPEKIRRHFGTEHYAFAVRVCLMQIAKWRKQSLISLPIRYVFDWEMNKNQKRKEISTTFDILSNPENEDLAEIYGIEPCGFSFEHKEKFKPLQAADILAWQMRSHMRKVWEYGRDDESLCHPSFRLLRLDQNMELGFMTGQQINNFVGKVEEWEKKIGPLTPLS
jgi:Protein of unknown function (DUF3800)